MLSIQKKKRFNCKIVEQLAEGEEAQEMQIQEHHEDESVRDPKTGQIRFGMVFQELIEESKEMSKRRKYLEMGLENWHLVLFCIWEFWTSTNSTLQFILKDHSLLFLIYSSTTVFRVITWIVVSLHVAPTKQACIKNFFKADDLFIAALLTIIAYVFQNSKSNSDLQGQIIANISLTILLFAYDGVVRNLIDYYAWTVKTSKLLKGFLAYGVTMSMVMGAIGSKQAVNGFDQDFYLLYRFTYLTHLCIALSLYQVINLAGKEDEEMLEEINKAQESSLNNNTIEQSLIQTEIDINSESNNHSRTTQATQNSQGNQDIQLVDIPENSNNDNKRERLVTEVFSNKIQDYNEKQIHPDFQKCLETQDP